MLDWPITLKVLSNSSNVLNRIENAPKKYMEMNTLIISYFHVCVHNGTYQAIFD